VSAPHFDPSSRGFSTSQAMLDFLIAALTPLMAVGYLGWVTGASAIEIVGMLVVFLAAAFVALLMAGRPNLAGARFGKDSALAPQSVDGGAGDVLEALQSLPGRRQRLLFLTGLAPVVVLPMLLLLIGDGGWLEMSRLRSLVLVSVVAAAFSSNLMFYWTRRSLAPLRSAWRSSQPSTATPGRLGGHSLATRLQMAVAIPAIAGLILVIDAASHAIRADAEANAFVWLASVVESLAETNSDRPLGARVEWALPLEKIWPVSTQIFEIPPDATAASVLADSSQSFLAQLDFQLLGESRSGWVAPERGLEIGAFRKLEGGAVLIARVARADLADGSSALGWGVLGVTLALGLVSILFGTMVSREFVRSFDTLRGEAGRIASGDLRSAPFDPSGDEFGELAQSLSVGSARFQATLSRTPASRRRFRERHRRRRGSKRPSSVLRARSLESPGRVRIRYCRSSRPIA